MLSVIRRYTKIWRFRKLQSWHNISDFITALAETHSEYWNEHTDNSDRPPRHCTGPVRVFYRVVIAKEAASNRRIVSQVQRNIWYEYYVHKQQTISVDIQRPAKPSMTNFVTTRAVSFVYYSAVCGNLIVPPSETRKVSETSEGWQTLQTSVAALMETHGEYWKWYADKYNRPPWHRATLVWVLYRVIVAKEATPERLNISEFKYKSWYEDCDTNNKQ